MTRKVHLFFFLIDLGFSLLFCVEEEANPFVGIQTGVVVREAYTLFNEQTLRTGKCITVLTKILYLITKGETFSDEEATQLFFAATKLFQSPHVLNSFQSMYVDLSYRFLHENTFLSHPCFLFKNSPFSSPGLGPHAPYFISRHQRAAHRL